MWFFRLIKIAKQSLQKLASLVLLLNIFKSFTKLLSCKEAALCFKGREEAESLVSTFSSKVLGEHISKVAFALLTQLYRGSISGACEWRQPI